MVIQQIGIIFSIRKGTLMSYKIMMVGTGEKCGLEQRQRTGAVTHASSKDITGT